MNRICALFRPTPGDVERQDANCARATYLYYRDFTAGAETV